MSEKDNMNHNELENEVEKVDDKDVVVEDTTAKRMIDKVAKGESFNWPNHFFPAGGAEQLANQASTQFYMDIVELGEEQAKKNYIAQMDGIMDGSIK